ncbi:hypothetical protein PaG_01741 [Moesziomyces aphidis]|uniref:Uncharacterized protein n=1 Tax=Moesziomyces aphidis TaxID=84754 RepID=W3VRN6_MOEAP|nr:hypothetical protein PaG_01741 [Moesziomyces aphidis]
MKFAIKSAQTTKTFNKVQQTHRASSSFDTPWQVDSARGCAAPISACQVRHYCDPWSASLGLASSGSTCSNLAPLDFARKASSAGPSAATVHSRAALTSPSQLGTNIETLALLIFHSPLGLDKDLPTPRRLEPLS